ncbi:RNA polymerase sigma factor [Niastella populi]|uniref:RNA polymerase sigma factor 70 region 4 type 2 domain-containing protein n=1 Tax=Niastella populi TaxID=550983 RepID=A0A1V9FM13_9BACT|nr:sigma-70 family RNA polymerase sigma factor [Niastella populi]OQP59380.1 hypothetical protein A4R26_21425 [Niastella populi]
MPSNLEIDLLNQRDNTVIDILYAEFIPPIFLFCLILLEDQQAAEDATQEALVKMWTTPDERFITEQDVRDYLFIVARNKCIDICRKNKRYKAKLRELRHNNNFEDPMVLLAWQEAEIINELHKAISRLTPEEAAVIKLWFWHDRNNSEISSTLNISPSTLYRRKKSAIDKLRKMLKNKCLVITVILLLSIVCAALFPKKTFQNLAVFYYLFVFNMG